MGYSIFFVILAILGQSNGQFDCNYDCRRGSCNPVNGYQDIDLKCSLWTTCGPYNAPCHDVWMWSCDPNYPYYGKITECNKTGCIPPFGCNLISFETSINTCQVVDDFCSSPTKACCNNDDNCDKYWKPCIAPVTIATNATTTEPSTQSQQPLNLTLIIGVVVGVSVVIVIISWYIVWRIRRRNKMQQPNVF